MNRQARIIIVLLLLTINHCLAAANEKGRLPVVIGENEAVKVNTDETIMEIARRAGLGYEIVANSNPHLDPWNPGISKEVLIPRRALVPAGTKPGIMINLAEMRLYHVTVNDSSGYRVRMYPLGIGRQGRETPEGEYRIVSRKEQPEWRVPEGLRELDATLPEIVQPGPQNPLGDYWLGLSAPGYGIHGTNRPYGVGRRVSYGCLRMYPEDIAELYGQVEMGTPVVISYQPVKAAWDGDQLLLEVHPDYLSRYEGLFQEALSVVSRTGWPGEIDYASVAQVVSEQNSLPQVIGHRNRE